MQSYSNGFPFTLNFNDIENAANICFEIYVYYTYNQPHFSLYSYHKLYTDKL